MTGYNDPERGNEPAAVVALQIALVIMLLVCACVMLGGGMPWLVKWLAPIAFRIGG